MPIKKFRSVVDMPPPLPPPPEARWRRITELWALSSRLHRTRFPAGVHKNRTIEEANRRRAAW
jgi:hypothetical protein